tara:strand:- start:59 stop:637 length:579 start_codon:yes stop_codon:yes gene_type:complete
MNNKMMEFENLLDVFEETIDTDEFKQMQDDFTEADNVYFIGNGGNAPVCSHASSDITRLTNKKCYSLDNISYVTSIANDYNYDNIYIKWLEDYIYPDMKSMVIGLSGSGNSKNVVSALAWANDRYNISTTLVSGQKSNCLEENINEVCFDRGYFHTVEILSELTFYQLIHGTGNACPTIKAELIRKYGKAGE